MKLKQLPTDFIVEEISNIEISKEKKEHKIFILEKKETDTFNAIHQISRYQKIPLYEIGYAGLKDKHATSKQYVSIPSKYNIDSFNLDNINMTFLGFNNKKIKIGDLKGNRFTITIRNIKQRKLDSIYEKANSIQKFGVPNYFDSQRFGSVFNNDFIAKHVIKKEYEKAVKIFLTRYHKSEKKNIKNDKRNILANWSNLDKTFIKNKILQKIIQAYLKDKDWLDSYKKIPPNLREMYINSYQSFLWNECVKELFRIYVNGRKLYSVEYAVGLLLFYKDLSDEEIKKISSSFPTLSETVKLDDSEKNIVTKILVNETISLQDLDIKSITGNFFKTRKRKVIVIPDDFFISNPMEDELNFVNGKPQNKIILSFSLPKGSYATIITKRLFGH
jgi:tRNA pseudouridine13 synthase